MKYVNLVTRGMLLLLVMAALVFSGCAGGAASLKVDSVDPKAAACKAACDEANTQCNEKCGEDADKAACELACKVASDKCLEDCKK